MLPREFREQHHADQEEIHIGSLRDRLSRELERHKAQGNQHNGASTDPVNLRDVAGPDQHQQDADRNDDGQQNVSMCRGKHLPLSPILIRTKLGSEQAVFRPGLESVVLIAFGPLA